MVTLEKELIESILGSNDTLTPSDVQLFFDRSQDRIRRLIKTKELSISVARKRIETLRADKETTNSDGENPIKSILDDLVGRLIVAKHEFEDRKKDKYDNLIKQLKSAVMSKRIATIVQCLFDINTLNNVLKDRRMVDLQEQMLKYSKLAKEDGKVYLRFYSKEEEQERLSTEILNTLIEIQALKTILNSD